MTTNGDNRELLAALHRLLDTWGGDADRWPTDVRRQIEDLMRRVPQANAFVAEARALDGALDMAAAPVVPAGRDLIDRIVTAAAASDRPRRGNGVATGPSGDGRVVPLNRRATRIAGRSSTPVADPMPSRARWQAAAVMAASLIAGIFLGGSVNLAPALQDFAVSVGVSTGVDGNELALGEDLADGDTL